jgi:hypothetical protein
MILVRYWLSGVLIGAIAVGVVASGVHFVYQQMRNHGDA